MSQIASASVLDRAASKPALILNRHGFFDSNTLSELAKTHGSPAVIDTQTAKYGSLLDELAEGVKIVAHESGLNALGKSKRRQALRDAVARQMVTLDQNQANKVASDLAAATAVVDQMEGPAKPMEVMDFLALQEIRADLKAMTPLDREAAVQSAAAAGQTNVVRAVVHAPTSLVSDRVRSEVIESWKRKLNPTAFDRLDAAVEVESTFKNNRAIASKALGKLVGTDPIETAAGPEPTE